MMATVLSGGGGAALYSIAGIVYDADGATPVSGATVALGAYSAVSAADGTYTITGIPPGEFGSMTCALTGYSWPAVSIAAMSGNLTAQNYINAWWASGGIAGEAIAAYKPIGASDLASSYLNLVNPGTFDAAPGTAPTFNTATGWAFLKTSLQYLNLGFVPDVNYSVVFRFSGRELIGASYTGCQTTTNTALIFGADSAAPVKFSYYHRAQVLGSPVAAVGVVAICGVKGYLNASLEGTSSGYSGTNTQPFYIGGYNNNGVPSLFQTITVAALAAYSTDISAQIGSLTAAINALP